MVETPNDHADAHNPSHTHPHAEHRHEVAHDVTHHEPVHQPRKSSPLAWFLTPMGLFFIACLVVIIVLTIAFRTPMLKFAWFYEPDGFYHYSVIRAAISHNFVVPRNLSISGWPLSTQVSEPDGLYWITLFPYAILQNFGVTEYTVERLVPILFGILDVIGVYFLARYLSKSKFLGILAMLFVALSGGDEARTSALIYRGDGFVSIFLIGSLVAFLEVFRSNTWKRKLLFALLSGFILSIANLVWNGASFAVGVYVGAFFLILVFATIYAKEEMIKSLGYLLIGAFFWYLLTSLYLWQSWTVGQTFMGSQFFALFIPMLLSFAFAIALTNKTIFTIGPKENKMLFICRCLLTVVVLFTIGWLLLLIAYFVTGRRTWASLIDWFSDKPWKRFIMFAIGAGSFVFLSAFFSASLINTVFVNNGFSTGAGVTGGTFTSTIQELQPPTPGFLFASFQTNLYSTLPSIAVWVASYVPNYLTIMVIVILLCFVPYLFMQVYDTGGFMKGRARITFDVEHFAPMAVIISYFMLTAYLQIHAIRFNSLISIPLALLSAYTVYWLIAYAKTNSDNIKGALSAIGVIAFAGLSILLQLSTLIGGSFTSAFSQAAVLAIITILAVLLLALYFILKKRTERLIVGVSLLVLTIIYVYLQSPSLTSYPVILWLAIPMAIAVALLVLLEYFTGMEVWYGLVLVFIVYVILYYNVVYTANLTQADELNPQFFAAMEWFKANSPTNSVALTLWPDGSVVEGVANRTSVTDSVGAQNYVKADAFGVWLFNSTPDVGFLTGNLTGSPDYLVTRYAWMVETSGIFTEASADESNLSEQNFSYVRFASFTEHSNATTLAYQLESQPIDGDIGLGAIVAITGAANSTSKGVTAYIVALNLSTGQTLNKIPLHAVVFYNESAPSYAEVTFPNASASVGYTIVLNYSGVPRSGTPVNVTGAIAVSPGLANSNVFKFLYLCDYSSCAWNSNNASLQLVYANLDTKIFKINYNATT